MKALVQRTYGPPENLRIADIDPPAPGPKDVLIRVRAAGVDPGIWHTITGRPLMVRLMGLGFLAPKVPVAGWDASGEVDGVGAQVTRFKVGDEVFGNAGAAGTGTFAEWACIPEDRCAPRPSNLDLVDASALAVSGCSALQAVRDLAKVGPGSRVLVIGAAGGVGHFAVQIARAFGATVTGMCSTGKVDLVRSLGAADVIDYTREGLGSRKWDAIIDTGGRRKLSVLRRALEPKGTLAIVGGEGGNRWTGGFLERMAGAALLSHQGGKKIAMLNATVSVPDLLALKELVEAGKLKPTIDRRYPLERSAAAVVAMEREHATGKSVVVVG